MYLCTYQGVLWSLLVIIDSIWIENFLNLFDCVCDNSIAIHWYGIKVEQIINWEHESSLKNNPLKLKNKFV